MHKYKIDSIMKMNKNIVDLSTEALLKADDQIKKIVIKRIK